MHPTAIVASPCISGEQSSIDSLVVQSGNRNDVWQIKASRSHVANRREILPIIACSDDEQGLITSGLDHVEDWIAARTTAGATGSRGSYALFLIEHTEVDDVQAA